MTVAEDRVTEDEISVVLRRTHYDQQTGAVHETIAFKPEPGETVAELAQRILTRPGLSQDGSLDRSHKNRVEIRLIMAPGSLYF